MEEQRTRKMSDDAGLDGHRAPPERLVGLAAGELAAQGADRSERDEHQGREGGEPDDAGLRKGLHNEAVGASLHPADVEA